MERVEGPCGALQSGHQQEEGWGGHRLQPAAPNGLGGRCAQHRCCALLPQGEHPLTSLASGPGGWGVKSQGSSCVSVNRIGCYWTACGAASREQASQPAVAVLLLSEQSRRLESQTIGCFSAAATVALRKLSFVPCALIALFWSKNDAAYVPFLASWSTCSHGGEILTSKYYQPSRTRRYRLLTDAFQRKEEIKRSEIVPFQYFPTRSTPKSTKMSLSLLHC